MRKGFINHSNCRYISKMEEEPCCPLCHRDMNCDDVGELASELTTYIRDLPMKVRRAEEVLKKENQKLEALMTLQPVVERLEQIKLLEIPDLIDSIEEIDKKLVEVREQKNNLETSLEQPKENLSIANEMKGDVSLLDDAQKEAERIRRELTALRAKMPEISVTMTMEEAQKKRTEIQTLWKAEGLQVDRDQANYDKKSEQRSKLREARNAKKDEQIKLQEGVQALAQLKQRFEEISKQISGLQEEVETIESKLAPLCGQLKQELDRKQKTKQENAQKLKVAQDRLNNLIRIDGEVTRCSEELRKLSELNLQEEMKRTKATLHQLRGELTAKTDEVKSLSEAIDRLKKAISDQAVVERDLNDNRELKKLQAEGSLLESELDAVTRKVGDLDTRGVSREKEQLHQEYDDLDGERHRLRGAMDQLKIQISDLEKDLAKPENRNAVRNYRRTFYELVVLKKMAKDLGKYYVALDWALMKFHEDKMKKINRLIRELWRSIYRGNDIDYIQIRTDSPELDADKKRSYNYRVIQSKNDVELDMRGRCSAGQRVLACLIIRIALAETFSSNCGVLALDEPTTNLDRVNIISLCEALTQIVDERSSQSNFMLLVITHDEDFINTLGRVNSYYKVSRSTQGKSIIEKNRVG